MTSYPDQFPGFGDDANPAGLPSIEANQPLDLTALEQDTARFSRYVAFEFEKHVEPEPQDPAEQQIVNVTGSPLDAQFVLFTQLQDMGYDVHLHGKAVTIQGHPLPGHVAVSVGREDLESVQQVVGALSKGGSSAPYEEFARRQILSSTEFDMHYIAQGSTVMRDRLESVLHDTFRGLFDGEGHFDRSTALELYIRASMTKTLVHFMSKLRGGEGPRAWAESFPSTVAHDYAMYAKLRAKGFLPLGIEEVHGLVARWLHTVLERDPTIQEPYSKRA